MLLAASLRLLYSLLGLFLTPRLRLDPVLIRSNELTDNLMQRADGLAYSLLGIWERFDTLWYLEIARHGYERAASVVFYPLYPLLIRAGTALGAPPLAAALAISTFSATLLFWGLLELLALDLPEDTTRRAALLLAAWPGSFIFFAAYPESLVLALTIWSILFARRGVWWAAGITGLLAGLAKAAGVLVIVPLAVLAWRERKARVWPGALSLLAPVVMALVLMGSRQSLPAGAYGEYWRTEIAFPLVTLWASVRQAIAGDNLLLRMNLGMLLLVGAAALWKRLRLEYTLYTIAALCLFLTKKTDPLLQSTMRYVLVIFPAHAAMAGILRSRVGLMGGAALLMIVNLFLMVSFFEWSLVL